MSDIPVWSPNTDTGLPSNYTVPRCTLCMVPEYVLIKPGAKRLISGGSILIGDAAVKASKKYNKTQAPEVPAVTDVASEQEEATADVTEEPTEAPEPEEKPKKKPWGRRGRKKGKSK